MWDVHTGRPSLSSSLVELYRSCPWACPYRSLPGIDAQQRLAAFEYTLANAPEETSAHEVSHGDATVAYALSSALPFERSLLAVEARSVTHLMINPRASAPAKAARLLLSAMIDDARARSAQFLVLRCDASDLLATMAIEKFGGHLLDCSVTYLGVGAEVSSYREVVTDLDMRNHGPDDLAALERITRKVLRVGRYVRDPRIDSAKALDFYVAWVLNAANGAAKFVAIGEREGVVEGFLCASLDPLIAAVTGKRLLHRGLAATYPPGRGDYGRILSWAIHKYAPETDLALFTTPVFHTKVSRAWQRIGLEPTRAELTFHLWLDQAPDLTGSPSL